MGEFLETGKMSAARVQHAAINLPDGRVLVMGGKAPNVGTSHNTTIHGSAEIYDPASGMWSDTGYMNIERYTMPVGLLNDGRVIVAGGRGVLTHALPDVDIWDPGHRWSGPSPRRLTTARDEVFGVVLEDGRFFVAGGTNRDYGHIITAEVYDPESDTWDGDSSPMSEKRRPAHHHTAGQDGRVLVVGGGKVRRTLPQERRDLGSGCRLSGLLTAEMNIKRTASHTATLLEDGRVLESSEGGARGTTPRSTMPTTDTWTRTPDLAVDRSANQYRCADGQDGRVMVAGGVGNRSSVEIYDPESDTWTQVADMLETRFFHVSTVLADGTVLIAGGNGKEALLSGTELFSLPRTSGPRFVQSIVRSIPSERMPVTTLRHA